MENDSDNTLGIETEFLKC